MEAVVYYHTGNKPEDMGDEDFYKAYERIAWVLEQEQKASERAMKNKKR